MGVFWNPQNKQISKLSLNLYLEQHLKEILRFFAAAGAVCHHCICIWGHLVEFLYHWLLYKIWKYLVSVILFFQQIFGYLDLDIFLCTKFPLEKIVIFFKNAVSLVWNTLFSVKTAKFCLKIKIFVKLTRFFATYLLFGFLLTQRFYIRMLHLFIK